MTIKRYSPGDLMTALLQIPSADSSEVLATRSARSQQEGVIAVELIHVLHSWIADLAQPTQCWSPAEHGRSHATGQSGPL